MDRILLIEDDPDDRALTERELADVAGAAELVVAADPETLDAIVCAVPIALLITDYDVGWTDAFAVLEKVRAHSPNAGALLFAVSGNEDVVVNAFRQGFDDFVSKSMPHRARLAPAVTTLLRRARERAARVEAEQRYHSLLHEMAPHAHENTIRPTGNGQIVLVAEDEPAVRTLTRKVLEKIGYRVLSAGDGYEALEVARAIDEPIDLLVTDVVMPGLNGRELVDRLLLERPDIRILYMSGYSEDAILQHGVLGPGTAFLEKPFTPDALARKVRDVMAAVR